MSITGFLEEHFRHFNAASLVDAARGYAQVLDAGQPMMVTLAGAMSTAELGRSLAHMIRAGKVGAITCTGANLEEDLFNLVAHDHYVRVAHYRDLSPQQEQALLDKHLNRVTDTCIPEEEAFRRIERVLIPLWQQAARVDSSGAPSHRLFPHEFLYEILNTGALDAEYQANPENSWLLAAAEKNLPLFVPGWEDSTLGNIYAARCIDGSISTPHAIKSGIEYMIELVRWYRSVAAPLGGCGFFQIGGGIAGDFPICVVPLIQQDLEEDVPLWTYFCQISDSTTSFGSYSGAVPNEKITWGKLGIDTPKFIIESDATIVAPLLFAHVMGW